ncbi:DUF1275 domain-containing protein [bacterium]|nr:DUF1275 domain-containing protein [bacterium]
MSEAFIVSVFLALGGGFQDAYTYMVRDHVFANAQTGNVVLMSTHLFGGEWEAALRYLLPLLAFVAGVLVAEQVQHRFKYAVRIHWRQGILAAEIVILGLVGLMPLPMNLAANMLVSFSCAMQVQSFRKVGGNAYASTMCIGNIRSGTEALSRWARTCDAGELRRAGYYFGVILAFAVGAGAGGRLSVLWGVPTIWLADVFLLIALLLMDLDRSA